MRNLIGRLNARPASDLVRIAEAWDLGAQARERAALVAALFRGLTDQRVVRDAWAALPADSRALVLALAQAQESQTIDALAAALGQPADVTREIALELFRNGWVYREGDGGELPVGVAPRLLVPRELAHRVRKAEDERALGDQTTISLPDLLAGQDAIDLEEAATRWGIPVVAGLLSHGELATRLLAAMADPAVVAHVARGLSRDAAAIWLALRNDAAGRPLALVDVPALLQVDVETLAGRLRLREALGAAEQSLLVWHTWREPAPGAGVQRALFVPQEIRMPAPRPAPTTPPAVPGPATVEGPATPFALAWDLLTLVRGLTEPDRPRPRAGQPFPGPWLRRLNTRLWRRGAELPPPGYVPFLVALARGEGVLAPEDGRNGPLVATPRAREWRGLRFSEQAAHLRWRWLSAAEWIEGAEQAETQIWGGDWRALRRKSLDALALLPAGQWHDLDAVARWIAERSPDLLGATFTASASTLAAADGVAARRAAAATAAALTIRRPFAWFGLVDVATTEAHGTVLRVTERGVAIAHGAPLPADGGQPRLTVSETGEITLERPQPLQVWSVMAFADLVALGEPARYALTERSVERAIAAGFDTAQIAQFLRAQAGTDLPVGARALLERERAAHPVVRLQPGIRLEAADADGRGRLVAALRAAGVEVEAGGVDWLLVTGEFADAERLAGLLRGSGFAPREDAAAGDAGEET
jgi:hypothetical protein